MVWVIFASTTTQGSTPPRPPPRKTNMPAGLLIENGLCTTRFNIHTHKHFTLSTIRDFKLLRDTSSLKKVLFLGHKKTTFQKTGHCDLLNFWGRFLKIVPFPELVTISNSFYNSVDLGSTSLRGRRHIPMYIVTLTTIIL